MKERIEKVLVNVKKEMEGHLNDNMLITEGILDSLDIMTIIMTLEEEFDIEIDTEDVISDNFESVDAILKLVEKC